MWFCHKGSMDVFIDTENYSHRDSPTNLTITFSTATNTTAAAQRHRLEAKEETGCNHQGPARLRSFHFGEHNKKPDRWAGAGWPAPSHGYYSREQASSTSLSHKRTSNDTNQPTEQASSAEEHGAPGWRHHHTKSPPRDQPTP